MDLSRDNLNSLFTSFNMSLNTGLSTADTQWKEFASEVSSGGAIESYPVMMMNGSMREWVGDRVINTLDGKRMDVSNSDYEHTEAVPRNDIEDDRVGIYKNIFTDMGLNAGNLWARLAAKALCAAGNWVDGTAFFSTSRKIGKKLLVNKSDAALSATAYETARATMMGYAGANGDPLGLIPNVLMVGPKLEKTARQILEAQLVSEGGVAVSNSNAGTAKVIINPWINGDSEDLWFLLVTTRGIKPVAVQKRKEGQLVRYDTDHDECVKKSNRCEYSLHYRGAAVAVVPQLVYGGGFGV